MSFFKKMFGGVPNRKTFSEQVLAELRERGVSPLVYQEADFALSGVDPATGGSRTYALHNVYDQIEKNPAQRETLVRDWCDSIAEAARFKAPESFEEARPMLMPMVRNAPEAALMSLHAGETVSFVDRPLPCELVASIVMDLPTSVMRLPRKRLEDWGVSEDAVWDVALANLRARSADAWHEVAPGLYQSRWDDYFDATRILLPDLIHRTGVAGNPVVMVPDRTHLLVAGSRDTNAVAALVSMGLAVYEAATYKLAFAPMELADGVWREYEAPPQVRPAVEKQRLRFVLETTNAQKDALQKRFGESVFVATLMGFASPKGTEFTASVWTSGVETIFAKADVITFVIPTPKETIKVKWDDALRVVGPLTPEPGLDPVRYRVTTFPTAAQLDELRRIPFSVD